MRAIVCLPRFSQNFSSATPPPPFLKYPRSAPAGHGLIQTEYVNYIYNQVNALTLNIIMKKGMVHIMQIFVGIKQ